MKLRNTNIIVIASLLALSGCGDGVWGNARLVMQNAIKNSGEQPIPHTREEINGLPYASIAAQLENNPPSLMVLGYADNDKLQWISSNSNSISTRNGRIVHTVGFDIDLTHVEMIGHEFLGTARQATNFPYTYKMMVDTKSPYPDSETLNCSVDIEGEAMIEILGFSYDTYLLEEKCESPDGWNVHNSYWADKLTGFVWRSRQGVVDGQYTIEINVLKPLG